MAAVRSLSYGAGIMVVSASFFFTMEVCDGLLRMGLQSLGR